MKNNIFILLFFFLQFSIVYSSSSQTKLKRGYIITTNCDTIYGLLLEQDIANYSKCIFREESSDIEKEYKPNEIIGYRFINGKYYLSNEVLINNKQQNVFLEFLIDGIVDVYIFKNFTETKYFIQKDGQEIYELVITEKKIMNNGAEYSIKNKTYVGYLNLLFADAPNFTKKVNRVKLTRKSLINISQDYHNQVCNDEKCIVYEKTQEKPKITIAPIIGLNKIWYPNEDLYFDKLNFGTLDPTPLNLNYGLSLNLIPPYNSSHFEILYQALIRSYTLEGEYFSHLYITNSYERIYVFKPYKISSTDLQHGLLVRYNFNQNKVVVFGELGIYLTQKLKQEKTGFENIDKNEFPVQNCYGGIFGIGLLYKYNAKNDGISLKLNYSYGGLAFSYFDTNDLLITLAFPFALN